MLHNFNRILRIIRHINYYFIRRSVLVSKLILQDQQLYLYKRYNKKPEVKIIDRLTFVLFSKFLDGWKKYIHIVKPKTVAEWHRAGFRNYWRRKSRYYGNNRKTKREIIKLIKQMYRENNNWCAPRIHGELLKLGYEVSERTVSRYIRELKDRKPSNSWSTFLKNQAKAIHAIDFFSVPTLFFSQLYVFFVISHESRQIVHISVSKNPDSAFVAKQLKATYSKTAKPKYLISDNDPKFKKNVKVALSELEITHKRITARSPWQNGFAERFVGNVRRELLNNVIIMNQKHLEILLNEYVQYYNNDRTHYSLQKDSPNTREIRNKSSPKDKVIAIPKIGGLHHKYIWKESA